MTKSGTGRVVLQVDDSEDERLLLKSAFDEAGVGDHLRAVNGGREALDYLQGEREFANRKKFPLPCLVLLDIKMPDMDGFDVLARIRANPRFRHLPVSMFSTSAEAGDIQRALGVGADSYIQKQASFSTQVEFARAIAKTWFQPHPEQRRWPRILLRKRLGTRHDPQAGCYLQPSGNWSENRETARQFAHTVDARWWAEEQQYLNAEIILAYPDPGRDYRCMRT